uniref:Neuromedin B receptor n=1 Tax=Pavo cristatus TaxID=9049 RepID=A0A8C9LFT6_PAVCR
CGFSRLVPDTTLLPPAWGMAMFTIRCVIPSLYLLIITVGLLGNVTLMKIFISNSDMRSVPNIFISSLAAGDLLLLMTCVPVDASRYFSEEWLFGEVGCKLIPAIQLTSVGVSESWAVPLANFPRALTDYIHQYTTNRPKFTCPHLRTSFWSHPRLELMWAVSLGLAAGMGSGALQPHTSQTTMETRKRLAKIVLVFVGFFAICWFPNHVLYMYRSFNYNEIDSSIGHMVVTLVARVLSFCNSCVNPFALYLLSESFRRHFNNQLRCRKKSQQERSTSYLRNSSAIQTTSLKSNTRNTVTSVTQLNGHNLKQEMSL